MGKDKRREEEKPDRETRPGWIQVSMLMPVLTEYL